MSTEGLIRKVIKEAIGKPFGVRSRGCSPVGREPRPGIESPDTLWSVMLGSLSQPHSGISWGVRYYQSMAPDTLCDDKKKKEAIGRLLGRITLSLDSQCLLQVCKRKILFQSHCFVKEIHY